MTMSRERHPVENAEQQRRPGERGRQPAVPVELLRHAVDAFGERAELVRLKLARSPLLRTAMERDNWHILTWENLGAFASRERPDLDDLEPYLGLGAPDAGDQLALFD